MERRFLAILAADYLRYLNSNPSQSGCCDSATIGLAALSGTKYSRRSLYNLAESLALSVSQ
jgi:hypothetical protein